MNSQSGYSHIDAVKSISNILREPAPRPEDESRETAAETLSDPTSAPTNTSVGADLPPAAGQAELPRDLHGLPGLSSSSRDWRAALWRLLVRCVEPIFRRLRDYLLEPLVLLHEKLNEKLDGHAA